MQETLILQGFHELEKIGENAFADSGRRGRVFESRHSDVLVRYLKALCLLTLRCFYIFKEYPKTLQNHLYFTRY